MKNILKKALCLALGVVTVLSSMVIAGTATTDPDVIYSEDFESYDSISSYTDLGWTTYTTDTTRLKFSLDSTAGNKRLKAGDGGWALTQIVSDDDMAGIRQYTISADIAIESMNYKGMGIYFNHKITTTEKNENNSGIMQFRNRENVFSGAMGIGLGYTQNSGSYQWGANSANIKQASNYGYVDNEVSHVVIEVDLDKNEASLYLNNHFIAKISDFAADPTTEGCVSLMFQSTVSYIDNIKITKGVNIGGVGHQRTTAAGETFGLRFVAGINAIDTYKTIGFDIVVKNEAGETVKTTGGEGNTVYKTVSGNVNGMDQAYAAGDYGYDHLFAITLTDIPANLGKLTFTVTPYAIDADNVKISYAPITVTYNGDTLVTE